MMAPLLESAVIYGGDDADKMLIKRIPRCSASGLPHIPSPLRGEGEGEGVGMIFHPPLIPLPSREGRFRIPRSLLRSSLFPVRKGGVDPVRDKSLTGFTLIEVIVVMAIVAIMAGIMVPFVYRIWEGNDIELTRERMLDLKRAMTGDPRMIQNGIRTNYGFVGDNGQLPASLAELLPSYLPSGFDPNKYNKDAWLNEFVYTTTETGGRRVAATLKSKGPDRQLGTSDDIDDNTDPGICKINESEVTPTGVVQGNLNFVFFNSSAVPVTPAYTALITAEYTGPLGATIANSGCISLNIGSHRTSAVSFRWNSRSASLSSGPSSTRTTPVPEAAPRVQITCRYLSLTGLM